MQCSACFSTTLPGATSCPVCGASLTGASPAGATLAPGTSLRAGRYLITAVLGQGGFGITYRAADSVLRRDVAVKEYFPSGLGCGRQGSAVVPPARGSPTERLYLDGKTKFLEEAQLLAGFSQNPSIPDVYDVFEENATAYMTMEFISGQTISDLLTKRGRLPEAEVLTYAEEIGMVLEDLHQAHLLHRDLKPDNIIVTGDGRVVVLDFGAARQFTLGQTKAMTAILTPGYAPPEQMSGRGQFGPQTDIYAFAATLYHLLTGQPPVPATDRAMELLNGRPDPLLRPRALNRGLSTKVEDAILQGLEIEADKRPQTANAFLQALITSTQAPLIPTQAVAPSYPTKKTRPLLMGLAVVAVLVIFLVIPRFVEQRNTSPAGTAVVGVEPGATRLCAICAKRQLTEADLMGRSAQDLTLMRNEIYAVHGRRFVRKDLQEHFDRQPWYKPNPNYSDDLLSTLEIRNAVFILNFQRKFGLVY